MQLNDTKIQEFERNEGIKSVLHCQDTVFFLLILRDLKFMQPRDFFSTNVGQSNLDLQREYKTKSCRHIKKNSVKASLLLESRM